MPNTQEFSDDLRQCDPRTKKRRHMKTGDVVECLLSNPLPLAHGIMALRVVPQRAATFAHVHRGRRIVLAVNLVPSNIRPAQHLRMIAIRTWHMITPLVLLLPLEFDL